MLKWLRQIALGIGILIAAGVVALLLQGTADQNVPPADAEYAHAQIAGSQLKEFPGADHLMVIWKSRQLSSIITSFLRSHPETNPGP